MIFISKLESKQKLELNSLLYNDFLISFKIKDLKKCIL